MNRVFFISIWFIGCANSPERLPEDVAQTSVESGFQEAFKVAHSGDVFEVDARYNPARCECPEFEVYIWDAWHRVYLVGQSQSLARIQAFSESEAAQSQHFRIEGRVLDGTKLSKDRVRFMVFEVE